MLPSPRTLTPYSAISLVLHSSTRASRWGLAAVAMIIALATASAFQSAEVVLIPKGAVWKYLDNGSNQGTGWALPSFDDSLWASGRAELGYGDGDEATVVSYGPDPQRKYITTYFRHTFQVSDTTVYPGLKVRIRRDDGAVVYLNGTEVFRTNMPSGAIGFTTRAVTSSVDENVFVEGGVPGSLLVNGNNVLAVEIHQADINSSDISFDLQLVGTGSAPPPAVIRGPYLQSGTTSSMVVRWRTDFPSDSTVRYGTTLTTFDRTAGQPLQTTEHVVQLTGLLPATRYYYSVGNTSSSLAGGDASHSFFTAPADPASLRIWAIGDSGTADPNAFAVRDSYYQFSADRPTDMWLMLGDNAYPNGSDGEYQVAMFDVYPTMLRKSVLWPALGNHDTAGSVNPPPDLAYFQMFTLPTNGEAGGVPSGTEKYYSYDYGNVHFIALDSMASDRSTNGPMLTWLRQDLSATNKDWIIAYFHHPPYSKGSHDSDLELELFQMRQNAVPILEQGGVDLVLAGHSHAYERSFLLNGHYGESRTLTNSMKLDPGDGREDGNGAYKKPATKQANAGAVYIVAGSGGALSGGSLNHPAMYTSQGVNGSLVIDVDGKKLNVKFLRSNGAITDYFTISKETQTAPLPAAPTALSATVTSPSRIDLSWTDNSDNETGFELERSSDGVSFTLLGTLAANVTAYVDQSVAAGNTYSYRVRAVNGSAASTYSDIATASIPQQPPAAPSNLQATAASSSRIDLRWTDASDNEGNFIVERSSDGVSFAASATLPANTTSYSDLGLPASAAFYYRVAAINAAGSSTYSNVASARTLDPPQPAPEAPSGLTASTISVSRIDLRWIDNSTNETAFEVFRGNNQNSLARIAALGAGTTTYSDTSVVANKTYYYRVRAIHATAVSNFSNLVSAKTPRK